MPSIKLSQQTYDEFERLKEIMAQLLHKDELDNDQVIASLVGGFLDSLNQETKNQTTIQGCCNVGDQTKQHHSFGGCCGGACAHKH